MFKVHKRNKGKKLSITFTPLSQNEAGKGDSIIVLYIKEILLVKKNS